MDTFRVRLNGIDNYQARPTPLDPPLFRSGSSSQDAAAGHFDDARAPAVPVIRVFGATETGQKVCAHVHGMLPYLYVEYRGSLARQQVKRYMQELRVAIDQTLAKSYRRKPNERPVYVGHISLVKAVPFFGYHVGYRFFLKIYLLNPINMTRFADLLHEGHILGQHLQPFEAHLSYLMQFMCDFNLYGCGYVESSRVRFREPVPDELQVAGTRHRWHSGSIKSTSILNPDRFPRQSHCSIEVDICVQDILNRLDVQARNLHDSFIEHFEARAPDEKLVRSLAGLWKDETRRRKRRLGLDDADSSSPFPTEVLVSVSAESRDDDGKTWLHEHEFRGYIDELIRAERSHMNDAEPNFADFVSRDPFGQDVQTALQSVQDFFGLKFKKTYPFDQDSSIVDARAAATEFESFASADFPAELTTDAADHKFGQDVLHEGGAASDTDVLHEYGVISDAEMLDEKFPSTASTASNVAASSFKERPRSTGLLALSNTQQEELAQSFVEGEEVLPGYSDHGNENEQSEHHDSLAENSATDSDALDSDSPRKRQKTFTSSPWRGQRRTAFPSRRVHPGASIEASFNRGKISSQRMRDGFDGFIQDGLSARGRPEMTGDDRRLLQRNINAGASTSTSGFRVVKRPYELMTASDQPPASSLAKKRAIAQLDSRVVGANDDAYSLPFPSAQPQDLDHASVDESEDMLDMPPPSTQPPRASPNKSTPTSAQPPPVKPSKSLSSAAQSYEVISNQNSILNTPPATPPNATDSLSTPPPPPSAQPQRSTGPGPTPRTIAWDSSQPARLAHHMGNGFPTAKSARTYCFHVPSPTAEDIDFTMEAYDRPTKIHQNAFFSNAVDVPKRPREYGGQKYVLESNTLAYLPDFDFAGNSAAARGLKRPTVLEKPKRGPGLWARARRSGIRNWEIAQEPPPSGQVQKWMKEQNEAKSNEKARRRSLDRREKRDKAYDADEDDADDDDADDEKTVDVGTTFDATKDVLDVIKDETDFGDDDLVDKAKRDKSAQQRDKKPTKLPSTKSSVQFQTGYMNIMSLEVHVNSRGSLAPHPQHDEITCIFWCLQADDETGLDDRQLGVLVLSDAVNTPERLRRQAKAEVIEEESELDLLNRLVDIVRILDPDILTGYEVHQSSWGYLIERARDKYDFNLCDELSRVKSQAHGRFGREADKWGFDHTSTVRVTGRHVINIWRAMRSELNLLQYTQENVVSHLLKKRIPHYSFADLTRYYQSKSDKEFANCVDYFTSRVRLNLDILDAQELVPRTSEQARLVGVDFFSVFSRGSQFKVESFMFRIAKPENYVLVSPSRTQVGGQNALECLPLVIEPRSAFYTSPMVVLDFQSLYPSIMIAYNYCYSTCLGRIVGWRGTNKMGFADFRRQPGLLELAKDHINISPNGLMFVKPSMRKSLLAKMLGEILETRVMVKSGMKQDRDDVRLQQLLNNRQLALKLMANVTYGYTSATYSGRMPCAEIADAIVQTARETLERSIAHIHSVRRWDAEVVYGDTDSIFVHLKGRTREQAFEIGAEMAAEITSMNPRPMKLRFEKVYHPCVLLTKKRYVGFKYESPDQQQPEFDAKGIETVRRDGTPLEQQIEERALRILFCTADLSLVKRYFQQQCRNIMLGRVSLQDLCFAREVKLGTYSDKGVPPAGALIATRRMLQDTRLEPQYGERVPYVVVTGAPGARLIDRCVHPSTLMQQQHDGGGADNARPDLQLDANYYINKNIIPPLERIFNLMGASVRMWWNETPRVHRIRVAALPPSGSGSTTTTATVAAGKDAAKQSLQQQLARRTIEDYMHSAHCLVCGTRMQMRSKRRPNKTQKPKEARPLCPVCVADPQRTLLALTTRARDAAQRARQLESVCRSCAGLGAGEVIRCDSLDCAVYYRRVEAWRAEARAAGWLGRVRQLLGRGALDW